MFIINLFDMSFARKARAHLFCSLEFHAQFNYMMLILFCSMIPFYVGYVTIYVKITFRNKLVFVISVIKENIYIHQIQFQINISR